MDNDSVSQLVDSHLIRWWKVLTKRIETIRDSGNVPILIALSRKMPRIIDWFIHTFLPKYPDLPSREFFDECELTTELSIPISVAFSCKSNKKNNISYILLDDIIIHGTTLRSVASDLYILSKYGYCGDKCYLSSVFMHNRVIDMPSNVLTDDVDNISPMDLDTTRKVIAEIAGRIRYANLPLDLEFPILRTENMGTYTAEFVYNHFKSINSDYTYLGKFNNTATTILKQDSEQILSDFTKIRFFESDRFLSFEVFSPYSLPDFLDVRTDNDIFTDFEFANLWKAITLPVIDFFESKSFLFNEPNGAALRQNVGRSLVVWTNYLLSLSFLMEKCFDIIPEQIKSLLGIYRNDIDLIIGSLSRERVFDNIRQIFTERRFSRAKISIEVGGMDCFAPKQFDAEYSLFKAYSASHYDSIQEVLATIFNYQNFANEIYDKPQFRFERLFYGETYASLFRICAPYFCEDSLNLDMNRWIDDQIDSGAVVPKYEFYFNEDGYRRWRRFFHAGLNIAES